MARYNLEKQFQQSALAPGVGKPGDPGEPGGEGPPGEDGAAATISIGTVTTLDPGESATVENVGDPTDAILNFGIPQGEAGAPGGGGGAWDSGAEDPNELVFIDVPQGAIYV